MLSIPHLIIIFVVALVVFGPEKLPDLARNLGKVMGEFRRATTDLRSTFEGHLRELERETEQRRIGASVPVEPTQTASDVIFPAARTVPATPPHQQLAGAAEDEFPTDAPSVHSASTAPPAEPAANPPSNHDSEIVSNGGHGPA